MNFLTAALALAQQDPPSAMEILTRQVISAIVFSVIGILVLMATLYAMEKLAPFSIVHEIAEEHNQALALIVSAIVLGIALIIAAAMLG